VRPKLVASSRLTKYYIVVSDGAHIQFIVLMFFKRNVMFSTKMIPSDSWLDFVLCVGKRGSPEQVVALL